MPLRPYACSNCGHWQKYFAVPPLCPVCSDVRNDLPDDGWDFRTPEQVAPTLTWHWREAAPGIHEFWTTPRFGLDSHGWLLTYPEGNVAFEAAPRGHYDGHAVLHDAERRALFAGDALKVDFDADGTAARISCHKAYHKQIPLSRDEARRYRDVIARLDFDKVFTPFEYAPDTTTAAAVALLDEVIAGPPFTHPVPIQRAAE